MQVMKAKHFQELQLHKDQLSAAVSIVSLIVRQLQWLVIPYMHSRHTFLAVHCQWNGMEQCQALP